MKTRSIYLLLVLMIIICSSTSPDYRLNVKTNNEESDIIVWSNDRKLIWEDFTGIPDTTESHPILTTVAVTSSVIKFEYDTKNNMVIKYKLEPIFIKSKSWTITNDIRVLAHEQLHFDITELYARKIRKAFDSLQSRKNYIEDSYLKVYNFNLLKKNELNYLYDYQSYGNPTNQNRWIKKIGAELIKLKEYEYIPND